MDGAVISWDRSPPTNVAWVRFWSGVIRGLSLLLVLALAPRVFLRVLRLSPSTKPNISKFQVEQERVTAWRPAKTDVAYSLNIVIHLFIYIIIKVNELLARYELTWLIVLLFGCNICWWGHSLSKPATFRGGKVLINLGILCKIINFYTCVVSLQLAHLIVPDLCNIQSWNLVAQPDKNTKIHEPKQTFCYTFSSLSLCSFKPSKSQHHRRLLHGHGIEICRFC